MLAGRFMRPGVPLTRVMAHLHVIGVDVIATADWDGPGQVRDALAATAGAGDLPGGTSELMTQIRDLAQIRRGMTTSKTLPEAFLARRTAPGPLVPTRGTHRLREFFLINML
jgi:hypothetical protein